MTQGRGGIIGTPKKIPTLRWVFSSIFVLCQKNPKNLDKKEGLKSPIESSEF
jgi:hypothetical protein